MNIAIYTRRSYYSDASESVRMQAEACRDYISRMGWDPSGVSVYEDNGFVRSDIDRPAMNRLRQDIEDGLVECVMVYRIDRITSRMNDFCNFYASLKDRGIKFVTVKDGIDTTTPIGEAMMYLAVIFSGIEVEQDALRITDNMRHLASTGYWCGGPPPLGYRIESVPAAGRKSHKILVSVPEDVQWKLWLVSIFLDNDFALQNMESWCKAHGVKAPGGGILSSTQLYQILTSPMCVEATPEIYDYFAALGCQMDEGSPRELWDGKSGVMVYGRTMERRVDGKKKHVKAPPENWRISLAKWEPHLSADLYLQVMSHFKRHVFDKSVKYDVPLLKGVLRCKCGRLMTTAWKKHVDGSRVGWYHCPRRDRYGKDTCDSVAVKTAVLDEKVLEIFRGIELDPALINKYIPRSATTAPDAHRTLTAELEKLEDKIDRLTVSLSENGNSAAAKYIVKEIEKLDLAAADLRRRISEQSSAGRRAAKERADALTKREEVIRLCQHIDELTAAEKNSIAREVIREAVWDNDSLKIML